jgi:Ca-activated chloride channel family protein
MMPSTICPQCGASAVGAAYCSICAFPLDGVRRGQEPLSACLRTTSGEPVPLLGVSLGGEVFGAHARLVLRQRYKNRESKPIEAVYTFPIPSDATLVGFAMECEGRRIEAEVKEREEAFATYDEAIAKGHGAALLEQERPNVFTASVGNLLPDEETVVEVMFLQKLTADEGALRLMIPTLVAPKYMPGAPSGDRTGHGAAPPTNVVPDADRISPKIGDVRYGLSMDVLFDLGREVTIESPSHAISTIGDGPMRKRVTFASPTVALDRDIVLVAEGAPGVAAGVVCDKPAGEEGTFALTIVPDLFEAKKRSKGRAVVFVVDVSGSMAGASIEQAKRAMHLCLRHLSEGDLFDILPFSSSFSHFSAQSAGGRGGGADMIPFTQTTLRQADAYVESLQANGGTEMLAPLSAAARLLSGLRRDRVIVLLTDGQVGNEAQIVEEISKQADGARVYTFGIGTNVSDVLLRGLAKRTKGAVEFIHPGERIDEKVTAQFARATAARASGVTLKWTGADAGEVAPADPPALVDGEPWSVYGRYEQPGIGKVEIRGTLGGENFYMEVPLELAASASRPALTSLWAGARVRDLEEVDASTLGRRAELHKKRIVDLCVRFGIASKYASFVVVEKRSGDRRSQGMPETRAVPVNAPAGWAMFGKGSVDQNMRTRAGTVPMQARMSMAMPGRAGMPAGPPVPRSPAPAAAARSAGAYVPADHAYRMAPPPPPGMAPPPPPGAVAGFGPPPPPPAFGAPPSAPPGFGPPPPPPAFGAPPGAPPPPPAYGAPPPPPPMAPMAQARPDPSYAAPAPAAQMAPARSEGGGLFERAKKALGLSKSEAASSGGAFDARSADDAAAAALTPRPGAPAEDIGAVFARQLASGLWEDADASDKGRMMVTTMCLVRCVREGIDTSHAVYGAQLTKAVEALSAVVEPLAAKGEVDAALITHALLAMAAVSTGKRARARLAAIASAAASPAVKAIAPDLAGQEAAKKRLG